MSGENGRRPGRADEASEMDAAGTPLERIAAALGYPATIFTSGLAVEPRLRETAELLRLWAKVHEPDDAQRILAFVAAIIAE